MPEAIVAGLLALGVIGGGAWYFIGYRSNNLDKKAASPPAAQSTPGATPAPSSVPAAASPSAGTTVVEPVKPAEDATPATPPAAASAPPAPPTALPQDDAALKAAEAQKAKEAMRQQELRRKRAEDARRKQEDEAQRKAEESKRMQAAEEKSRREAEEARRRMEQQAKPAPVPAPAQPQGPRSAQEACTGRPNFISRSICESRACERPEFRNQDYCVQMRSRQQQQPGIGSSGG